MSFARIATLRVSDNSYDLMHFRYGFRRDTDFKGRPSSNMYGGSIVVTMESTKSTELLERFLNTDPGYPTSHPPRVISGSIEVCDPEDGRVIRKLVFAEAFIYAVGERMHTDSPLPMMETITISPLRLDIDRTIRLDRRWPQAPSGWQEFVQEEQPRPVSFMESIIAKVENEKKSLTCKKPKNSPDPEKWKGKVEVLDDGTWRYTDCDGNVVDYKNGYPDFSTHSRQIVDIGKQKGNHTSDYTNARNRSKEVPPKLKNTTWHHHEDGKSMVEIDKIIHRRFTHNGGVSASKKKVSLGKK